MRKTFIVLLCEVENVIIKPCEKHIFCVRKIIIVHGWWINTHVTFTQNAETWQAKKSFIDTLEVRHLLSPIWWLLKCLKSIYRYNVPITYQMKLIFHSSQIIWRKSALCLPQGKVLWNVNFELTHSYKNLYGSIFLHGCL